MRFLFLTGLVAFPLLLSAQSNPIPNAGFESWTDGIPDSWITTNIPGVVVPITQSATAHTGSSSLQGAVLTISTSPYPPVLQAFFPVTASYGSLTGWYRYTPVGGDSLLITIIMYKDALPIGSGTIESSVSVESFSQFTVPIEYFQPGPADTAFVVITVTSSDDVHPGSTFIIDDLEFGAPTSIGTTSGMPATFALGQNYPNPFNPSTTISFDLPTRSAVRITVLNILGQQIDQIFSDERPAGSHTVSWTSTAPSGVYYYRLDAMPLGGDSPSFSETRRMLLLK